MASSQPDTHSVAMRRLLTSVQDLSQAHSLQGIISVVRRAARELAGADGASFILRQRDKCFYADEDAIGPLWKGQEFPMAACVSGWAMLNRQPAVIPDIYSDSRVPIDAYRPTFVRSLVMVPIRTQAPIGAIGAYWAHPHAATPTEVELLQALANTTSVAMENVRLYNELDQRVKDRTQQLEAANRDLEAFSASVSHDLRGPLQLISGFSELLEGSVVGEKPKLFLEHIRQATTEMSELINDLLRLAQLTREPLKLQKVDLSPIAKTFAERCAQQNLQRRFHFKIDPELVVCGDAGMLRIVLENLLSNACKYTAQRSEARIELRRTTNEAHFSTFCVSDNGAGFDMANAEKLFTPFQRLHEKSQFDGHGIGLATVHRIVQRHGGRIWAEAKINEGATFWISLPDARDFAAELPFDTKSNPDPISTLM